MKPSHSADMLRLRLQRPAEVQQTWMAVGDETEGPREQWLPHTGGSGRGRCDEIGNGLHVCPQQLLLA